jgi:NAD(P)-dependent dehydrogenase (short-subunit alcohol dehydrogenase family)
VCSTEAGRRANVPAEHLGGGELLLRSLAGGDRRAEARAAKVILRVSGMGDRMAANGRHLATIPAACPRGPWLTSRISPSLRRRAMPRPLAGKVAVVAGATRGAGRGIATALGEAGATVFCTGRSVPGSPGMKNRPETIQETASVVTARGGQGIAVRVDHTVPGEVASLFERVGEFDILVNDVWGGDDLVEWGSKLWETKLEDGLLLIDRAIKTHIITSYHGIPRMRRGGLVVEITDGDSYFYRGHFFYDLVKTTVIRMAFALSQDLKNRDITALAVTPGFLRSEWMLDHFGVTEENWREAAKKVKHFIASETPLFVGRCVAALAADPNVTTKNGRVFASWDLGDEYGVTDADGTRPHFVRWLQANDPEVAAGWKKLDDAFYAYWGKTPGATPE